jgi:hypothetical protein
MVMNTRWFYLLSKLQRERGREGGERERERCGMLRCGSDFNGQSRIHA